MTIREEVWEKFGVQIELVAANFADKAWESLIGPLTQFQEYEMPLKALMMACYLNGFRDLAEVIGRRYE